MLVLYLIVLFLPWFVPAITTAVLLGVVQKEGRRISVFPTVLLSIPFTVVLVFLFIQLLRFLDRLGSIEIPNAGGTVGGLVYLGGLIGFSSIIATYFSAKFFTRKEK